MNRVLVIGAARSGVACAKYLLAKGETVFLADMNSALAEKVEAIFSDVKPNFIWGEQPDILTIRPHYIVMSPGVPLSIPPVATARVIGIPVISEPELAFQESQATYIGVTGTNGKTTTTVLTATLLEGVAPQVLCAGNIGRPLIDEAPNLSESDLVVAELSSFQLEAVKSFRPRVAIFLNLTPDHLDRHKTMFTYGSAKAGIFSKQRADDLLIYNADDAAVVRLAKRAPGKTLLFSLQKEQKKGMWLSGEEILYRLSEEENPEKLISRHELLLPGEHNLENVMAAALTALYFGQDKEIIRQRLAQFEGVAHRLENVATIAGVRYINDSKGTNVDASAKALQSFAEPIVAILGGRNKGSDLTSFAGLVKERCRAAVLVGEARDEFADALSQCGFDKWEMAESFADAVRQAAALAKSGDVVLLSPACASWDMFDNFEERGNTFKKLVKTLEKEFA